MKKILPFIQIKNTQSISWRLLKYILLVSSFITLLGTGLQLYLDYREDVGFVEYQFREVERSYLTSISDRLWDLDSEGTQIMLNGILAFRDVEYLVIQTEDGEIFSSAGERGTGKVITRRFPLYHDGETRLGFIEVVASMVGIYRRLLDKIMVILATQAIKTFVVSTFILFIIQYVVTRHLATLGEYAKTLDLSRLDRQLVLNRIPGKRRMPDEIDLVVSAINEMRLTLKRSFEEIRVKARMEGELSVAASIQRSFLPKNPPQLAGYNLSSIFIPAREMSGDYYDFIPISNRYLGLVVADASGKGMPAAMIANTARVLLKDKTELHTDPVALFCSLNASLEMEFPRGQFLTMGYLLLDLETAVVTCVSAGHEPLVRVSRDEPVELVKPSGYPFCRLHTDHFDQRIRKMTFSVQAGELLVLYSDGLTDVVSESGEMFGENRFYALMKKLHPLPAHLITEKTGDAVRSFQGSCEQNDDITMIVLKRL